MLDEDGGQQCIPTGASMVGYHGGLHVFSVYACATQVYTCKDDVPTMKHIVMHINAQLQVQYTTEYAEQHARHKAGGQSYEGYVYT